MLLKKLRMLFVIALIAIFAVACSPNAGTDQGENPGTGTEEPGTDPSDPDTPENPGTDTEMPALNGDFDELYSIMSQSSSIPKENAAGMLLRMAFAIGMDTFDPQKIEFGKDYTLSGEELSNVDFPVAYWGLFRVDETDSTEPKMTADGRIRFYDYIFDIEGTMDELKGTVKINNVPYSFNTNEIG